MTYCGVYTVLGPQDKLSGQLVFRLVSVNTRVSGEQSGRGGFFVVVFFLKQVLTRPVKSTSHYHAGGSISAPSISHERRRALRREIFFFNCSFLHKSSSQAWFLFCCPLNLKGKKVHPKTQLCLDCWSVCVVHVISIAKRRI